MSTSVLLVLSALLIIAGAVSITAAAMGNPIRIGGTSIPGPDTAVERAVIAVVGAICVAAVIPVFLVGGTGANAKAAAVNPPVTPDPIPTVTTDPSPSPSPVPAAGPSTVTAKPGVPTVTAISIVAGPANGCARTFTASVRISDGPVNVVYRTLVDGVRVGPVSKTKSISGTGLRTLDSVQVTATHSGAVNVRFDVIDPNPTLLSGTTTWTAPNSCAPVVQPPVITTTTTQPPPATTLLISDMTGTGPLPTDPCTNVTVNVSATLTVGSAPDGVDVTYSFQIGGLSGGGATTHVAGSLPVTGSAVLGTVNPGDVITIVLSASGAVTDPGPATIQYTLACTPV